MPNKLHDVLTSVRDEKKTGRILASLGTSGALRSVAISVQHGEIIDISDSKAGLTATDFWNLPVRNAFFVPRDHFDDLVSGGRIIELEVLLKLLLKGGKLPAPPPASPSVAAKRAPAPAAKKPPEVRRGKLWQLSERIDQAIAANGLDRAETRGRIGLAAGVLMDFDPSTPDDDELITNVLAAANSILGDAFAAPAPTDQPHSPQSQAHSLKSVMKKIEQAIAKQGLDPAQVKGEIGLKAEVFLDFDEDTPDDVQLANRILAAAREVLGEVL